VVGISIRLPRAKTLVSKISPTLRENRSSRKEVGERVGIGANWHENEAALRAPFVLEVVQLTANESSANFQIVARSGVADGAVVLEGIVDVENWNEDSIADRCVISSKHPHVRKADAVRSM